MPEHFAITIWQPWASLIAHGAKRFEFRKGLPPEGLIGSRVAIHAGKRAVSYHEVRALRERISGPHWHGTGLIPKLAAPVLDVALANLGALPRSSILCTAILGKPIRDAELEAALGVPGINDSDRDEHSNWGWPLTEIERLEPFQPASGKQGWWKVLLP